MLMVICSGCIRSGRCEDGRMYDTQHTRIFDTLSDPSILEESCTIAEV